MAVWACLAADDGSKLICPLTTGEGGSTATDIHSSLASYHRVVLCVITCTCWEEEKGKETSHSSQTQLSIINTPPPPRLADFDYTETTILETRLFCMQTDFNTAGVAPGQGFHAAYSGIVERQRAHSHPQWRITS